MKLPMPQIDLLPERGGAEVDEIRAQVWGLLTTLYPQGDLVERRRDNRYPFPCLLNLTPVGNDGIRPEGETVVVVGKHLSEHGLSFFHRGPLPYRKMLVSIEARTGQSVGFVIDLRWCRFTKGGWYESGGRFLQTALPPQG
jgi:hypothetical protein